MSTESIAERVAKILEPLRGECLRDDVFRVVDRQITRIVDEAVKQEREEIAQRIEFLMMHSPKYDRELIAGQIRARSGEKSVREGS